MKVLIFESGKKLIGLRRRRNIVESIVSRIVLVVLILLIFPLFKVNAQKADAHDSYPANYASAPRFKALLVYSETAEPAHVNFANDALKYFKDLTVGDGWILEISTSFNGYTYEKLKDYNILIVINTSPAPGEEREAFEQYMENGGGWLGFHAAGYNDPTTNWPWFNKFLGCGYFYCNNWPPQPVLLTLDNCDTPITRNLPKEFVAPESEWYQFEPSPRTNEDVEILVSISPKNYPLGLKDVVNFGDFPVVWRNKKYRMVYLNFGHGDRGFADATQNLLTINAFRFVVSQDQQGNPFN